ncbi:MAG: hypothetical protein ACUVUD_01845 [bacterium]
MNSGQNSFVVIIHDFPSKSTFGLSSAGVVQMANSAQIAVRNPHLQHLFRTVGNTKTASLTPFDENRRDPAGRFFLINISRYAPEFHCVRT